MSHQMLAKKIASRHPILLEIGPAIRGPTTDTAARADPMAPWMMPWGLSKYSKYWIVSMMADIDEISKPKLLRVSHVRILDAQEDTHSIPPTVAIMARK
jgi:hypothetical protein